MEKGSYSYSWDRMNYGYSYSYFNPTYYTPDTKGLSWKDRFKSRFKSSLGNSGRLIESTRNTYSSSYWGYGTRDIKAAEILVTKTYKAARDLIVILGFPFNILIQMSKFGSELKFDKLKYGFKNYRILQLPTKVLDETEKYSDEEERINICCGLGIHEAAHLKYTSAEVINKFEEFIGTHAISSEEYPFVEGLINLIEDERIETLLLSERPGYLDFIDKAKTYQYKKFVEKSTGSSECDLFMYNLFRLIRYPENLDEDILEKYKDKYKKIQDFLTPYPQSTKESCIAGYKIYKEIKNIVKTDFFANIEDLEDISNIISSMFRRVTAGTDCQYDSSTEMSAYDISAKILDDDTNIISKLTTGIAIKGENPNVYFEKIVGDKDTYLSVQKKIQKFVPAIKKILIGKDKNYDFIIHGCRTGILDTTKLAEAYQGVPQVYIQTGHVRTNKTTVCILIDESGSMSHLGRDHKAREAAILLNEAFKTIPGIDLYIYGHTADITCHGSTELNIYREKTTVDEYALSEIKARHENRDGTAIYEAARRVRKFTKSHCIMFVISDGEPAAYCYWGDSAYRDVRENVRKIERDGFDVIQISIDRIRDVQKMFDKYITIDNVSNLQRNLSQIVKKVVLDDKKTTIS